MGVGGEGIIGAVRRRGCGVVEDWGVGGAFKEGRMGGLGLL